MTLPPLGHWLDHHSPSDSTRSIWPVPSVSYLQLPDTIPPCATILGCLFCLTCCSANILLFCHMLLSDLNSVAYGLQTGPVVFPFWNKARGCSLAPHSAQNKIPRVWWRYIDNIFTIWDHDEPSLHTFLENLNHHHPTVRFTATWSAQQVVFLDIRVYLKNGYIETDLHVKTFVSQVKTSEAEYLPV